VFARLYISQVSLFEQDPGEAIASAIGKHVFVPSRGFKWCIADAQPGPERVVLGRLARIKHETGTTRGFDERHWSIVTERREEDEVTYATFALDLDRLAIAFEETRAIRPTIFCNRFADLAVGGGCPRPQLTLLAESMGIGEWFKTRSKITRLHVSFRVPNPHDEPEDRDLLDILNEARARKGTLELANEEDGLNPESGYLDAARSLTERDYAELTAESVDGDEASRLDSRDPLVRRIRDGLRDDVGEVGGWLTTTLRRLFQ
jgi:hypothetical protein